MIGKRTWGGLVGRAFAPQLMDGGFVSAPSSAVFNPMTGQWEVENIGVAPDIEVEFDPEAVRQGKDPQLEKAVELVLGELARAPLPQPKRPAYPNYHKKDSHSHTRIDSTRSPFLAAAVTLVPPECIGSGFPKNLHTRAGVLAAKRIM